MTSTGSLAATSSNAESSMFNFEQQIRAIAESLTFAKNAKITDEVIEARKLFVSSLLNVQEQYLKVSTNTLESWYVISQPIVDEKLGKAAQVELGWRPKG